MKEDIFIYDFGIRLKSLRKKKGLSQSDVASKLEVNKATISAYERNTTTPSVDTITKLALIYGASVDYILGLENRHSIFIDDLNDNQQNFIKNMVDEVRDKFSNNK